MKNSVLALFLLLSVTAFSQRDKKHDFEKENFFRVGFKAELNVNKIDGKSFKDEFSYNYGFGGFVQLNFSRVFGLQPEVNILQGSAEQSSDFSSIYDDIDLGGSQRNAKYNFLKVAPLLNINVGPTQRIKLQVGPQWGLLLNEKVDSVSRNIFRKGQLSATGGLMIQLPFVHVGGRYEIGLTNMNDIDNKDRWRSQAFQIFAGVTF